LTLPRYCTVTRSEGQNLTPHRAGFATLPVRNRPSNRDWKARLIRPGSGHGSAAADGKAAPHPGAANTQPTAKKKLSEHPGNQS
jgi:hypothetical protein